MILLGTVVELWQPAANVVCHLQTSVRLKGGSGSGECRRLRTAAWLIHFCALRLEKVIANELRRAVKMSVALKSDDKNAYYGEQWICPNNK